MKRKGSSLTIHQTRDSIADVWGERTPHFGDWPTRVDERWLETPARWVRSTCVLCEIRDGTLVEVESRRGRLRARAMIDEIRPGLLFVPFHYGAWDGSERRAANLLTSTDWDPVSKQPHFKFAAVRLREVKEASDGRAR